MASLRSPGMDAEGVEQVRRALDHAVAEAADAWLNDPRDHEAYRRLVAAVFTRRANYQPPLELGEDLAEQPELDDALADRNPVAPISDVLDPSDPRDALDRLRGSARTGPD